MWCGVSPVLGRRHLQADEVIEIGRACRAGLSLTVDPNPGWSSRGQKASAMSKRDGDIDKREIRLPDGRRLIFYSFPDSPRRPEPPPAATPVNPSGQERH
jgi:hypothetical protein